MKKITVSLFAAAAALFTGCKAIPSEESLEKTSTSIGKAAAKVANQIRIEEKTKVVVVEMMTSATNSIPNFEQNLYAEWKKVAKKVLDKYLEKKEISEDEIAVANKVFDIACKGAEYVISKRYPKVKEHENLRIVAIKGFASGFLSAFKVSDALSTAAVEDYDREAFEYLKN